MNYNLEGTVKVIENTMVFDSGFQKREIVITTQDGNFTQDVKLEFTKDGVTKLDSFKVGDAVSVAFSIRGNEYNGKYYVNLNAFAIAYTTPSTNTLSAPTTSEAKAAKAVTTKVSPVSVTSNDDGDDLPF